MTAQVADVLLHEGERYPLLANPLESLWSESRPRPFFNSPHTANWRGYVATWEIRNRGLWLTDLSGFAYGDSSGNIIYGKEDLMENPLRLKETGEAIPVTVSTIFPDQEGSVFARWFSGTLRLPRGPLALIMGYSSVFEHELHITFQDGNVVKEEEVAAGELWREENRRWKEELEVPRVAKVHEDGWLKCPHCGASFSAKKGAWLGDRHGTCGGRIILE